ncbi:MAG TPA: PucR family transcriptional regulator ligand-binding domain-containing protein [Anaerovoracaceae bacterium]|nr:PucR family transcriptional regulator ligand-binding domain-containing protein [Anaerovoracaceae bacterium]
MPVKVRDILKLELMSSYRIVAGSKGLDKEIGRINFTDCPLDEEYDVNLCMANDFYINSFYTLKNSTEAIKKMIEFYISTKSSGVFIIDEYLHDIPEQVKKVANDHKFPVIFIDTSVQYGEIIRIVTEMILLEKIEVISESLIDRLLDQNISKNEIINLALKINGEFRNYYVVMNISLNNDYSGYEQLKSSLDKKRNFKILKYKRHLIVILNFDLDSMAKTNINYISSILEKCSKNYIVGVSNTFTNMEEFNVAVRQAISANEMSDIINNNVIMYKELNVYKLLYLLKDTRELREYQAEIIDPLVEYDKRYNSNLLETIESYIENDGDYEKMAKSLYLHENTVRYRIQKAKKILNLENHIQFIEQVYIGLKINMILKKKEKIKKKHRKGSAG